MTALSYFYIFSAALFILGLKGLSSHKYARKGMFLAELGMLMAIIGTLFHHEIINYKWIIVGVVTGSGIGVSIGLWVPMTAMSIPNSARNMPLRAYLGELSPFSPRMNRAAEKM